jgi:transaldolase
MLDCADVHEWETWFPTGLFYGVTTNPLLLERAGLPCTIAIAKELSQKAFDLGAQEFQVQAWGGSIAQYVSTGQALAAIDPRIVVKVPITRDGTMAATQLIRNQIRITLTAVYAVPQVLLAAGIGASYAAPYLGRIHDTGRNGCADLMAMQRSLDGIGSATRLLVASIRRCEDITTLMAHGLNTFTISPAIATQLFADPLTHQATLDFEQAAQGRPPA